MRTLLLIFALALFGLPLVFSNHVLPLCPEEPAAPGSKHPTLWAECTDEYKCKCDYPFTEVTCSKKEQTGEFPLAEKYPDRNPAVVCASRCWCPRSKEEMNLVLQMVVQQMAPGYFAKTSKPLRKGKLPPTCKGRCSALWHHGFGRTRYTLDEDGL